MKGDQMKSVFLETGAEMDELEKREKSGEIEIKTIKPLPTGTHMMIQYKAKEEKADVKTSLIIAVFTTAMARVRLNAVLQEYAERVIYADTDSVYLVTSAERQGPEAPGHIGTLKDECKAEFPGKGAYISEMICLGPKSYCKTIVDRHGNVLAEDVKLKGVQLVSGVNLDKAAFKQLLHTDSVIKVPQTQFKKNIHKGIVTTNEGEKKVSFCSTKRWILCDSPDYDTLPYGFKY